MSGPLADVRVLDLSRILAGPWASQLLADLGADVVKVERPGSGDDTRSWGPPFFPGADGAPGEAAYFACANRNKRSVAIDFTTPEGRGLVTTLAAESDILIENFRTGALARHGLDYASLRHTNPRLVYCSITGFGQTGPEAARAGYDFLIQGMSGLMSVTGAPDGEPMKTGVAVSDLFSGLYAATGVLAALHQARATGEGQHVDIALMDCQMAALANQAANFLASGAAPGRLGNAHPNIVPYQAFETADGHIILAVGNDAQFRAFCEVAGADDLAADPDFATNPGRVAGRERLIPAIAALMGARTSADWIAALAARGVPCGPIHSIAEAFTSKNAEARDMTAEMARPDGLVMRTAACPVKLSGAPNPPQKAPPALGGDTETVLRERLGLDADRIADLRAAGAIG